MAHVEEVVEGFTPAPGVRYTALALNAKGVERRAAFAPKVTAPDPRIGQSRIHLDDVFVQRNTARTMQDEIDALHGVVRRAVEAGAKEAQVSVNACWGSNWIGEISEDRRTEVLQLQIDAWAAAGVPVTRIHFGDPMSWNTPVGHAFPDPARARDLARHPALPGAPPQRSRPWPRSVPTRHCASSTSATLSWSTPPSAAWVAAPTAATDARHA